MKLYTFWRSSASYRLRIALELKQIAHEQVEVDLLAGDQEKPEYLALNPQGLVPALIDGEHVFAQSLAALEYLDETHPEPPLLPPDPAGRARVRQLALVVACEIHPLQNLRILRHVAGELGAGDAGMAAWFEHWVGRGFTALEALVAGHPQTGRFCHGDRPTLADVCLVPQLYNARRRDLDLSSYSTLVRIERECLALDAFASAAPDRQPHAG